MISLWRPCARQFADGVGFGAWGSRWHFHFDEEGKWIAGQALRNGTPCGQHGGRDLLCPETTMLTSPCDIENILAAGWQDESDHGRGYGLRFLGETTPIEYAPGKFARLILTMAHLSEIWAKRGAPLARGETFGLSGNTGNSSGAHLHVQLELPGEYPRTPLDFSWRNHFQ